MAPKVSTNPNDILDVFQPGLVRGAERLPYDPSKEYFYVEHPTEGWRVYLRSACFIHELNRPFVPDRFLVVKRTGAAVDGASWEAPKGQMEGRDGLSVADRGSSGQPKSMFQLLRDNVRREVQEEAKLKNLRELVHTGLVLQSVEPDFPPNTFFQYHIFSAYAHPTAILNAFEEFKWLQEHPAAFRRLRRDNREKDALAWYEPGATKLMGRWSPRLAAMYLGAFKVKT